MTLAVRSAVMEHYKSTLATTAFAVFGLVAAAHSLHPGNYEPQPRLAGSIATAASAPTEALAWIDPPARMATAGVRAVDAAGLDLEVPRREAEAPSGAVTVPALRGSSTALAEPSRRALAAHRWRAADHGSRRTARLHHAPRTRTAAADPAAAAPAVAAPAQRDTKVDPIGDLIRGLGLGRDG